MQNNYRLVNTCSTCKHHKEIMTIDWKYWECNLDKTFKLYKTDIFERTDEELLEQSEWLLSHEVKPNYICDDFE